MSAAGESMNIISVFHADHGVSNDLLLRLLKMAKVPRNGFFLKTLELPEDVPSLTSALYGPVAGDSPVGPDEVVYLRRSPDRPLSRMVHLPVRLTREVTIIGTAHSGDVVIFTAYGGKAAPKEVMDPTHTAESKAEAEAFWSAHALGTVVGAFDTHGGIHVPCDSDHPDAVPGIGWPVTREVYPAEVGLDIEKGITEMTAFEVAKKGGRVVDLDGLEPRRLTSIPVAPGSGG